MAVRPLTESDHAELEKWLAGKASPEVFHEQGCKALVVTDAHGEVMFVRLSPAWRVDIQFLPELNTMRTAFGIKQLVEHATETYPEKEYLFDTHVSFLARFMKRFKFFHAPDTYILRRDE